MDFKTVIALVQAGYTKEEIAAMQAQTPAQQAPAQTPAQQAPAQTPAQQAPAQTPAMQIDYAKLAALMQAAQQAPAQTPAQQQAPAQEPAQQQAPAEDPYKKLLEQMGVLTSAVQASNLLNTQQPEPRTADTILAEIINPAKPDKKKEENN